MLYLNTAIPEYNYITEASAHDVNILDQIDLLGDSYLLMDRAYGFFVRLHDRQ